LFIYIYILQVRYILKSTLSGP